MKFLYLVETEGQVADLLNKKESADITWLALTPFSMYGLDKNNIKYNIPEDYYNNEDLWEIGLHSTSVVNEICRRLDNLAMSKCAKLKDRDISLYTQYNFPLYVVFDGILNRIFQLKSIFEQLKPRRVVCYKSGVYPFYWRGIGFNMREFLYSNILEASGWPEDIDYVYLSEKTRFVSGIKGGLNFKNKLNFAKHQLKIWFPFLNDVKRHGMENALKRKFSLRDKPVNACLIGGDYEWEECEDFFNATNVRINRLDIKHNEQGYPVKDIVIDKDIFAEIKDLLIFEGIDIAHLVMPRLSFIYKEGTKRCIRAYDYAEKEIRRMSPRVLLFSTLATPEWRSAALTFVQKKIPTFCKSHGAVGSFDQLKILDNELLYANYYLANGEEVSRYYQGLIGEYPNNHLKIMCTGSPKLEALQDRKARLTTDLMRWLVEKNPSETKKKICIYVTIYYQQNLSYSCYPPPHSDRVLFKTQKTMLNFLKGRKDCLIIWKLHPNRLNDRPPYIEAGFDNIFTVRDEMQFIDLLDIADFIIFDAPATACLQAMTKKIPIFGLMKHITYFDKARGILEKRAVCCDEPEDLIKKIEDYLSYGKYEVDVNDDSFFRAYGNDASSTSPAKRTVSEVIKVIKEKSE